MSKPIDWTTTDGCPVCWEHGPFRSDTFPGAVAEAARAWHQAAHEMTVSILRLGAAFTGATKADFTLAGPSDGSAGG